MATPNATGASGEPVTPATQPAFPQLVAVNNDNEEPSTMPLRQRLAANERHWIWRTSLRSVLVVLNIVVIALSGWLYHTGPNGWAWHLNFFDIGWAWIYIIVGSILSLLWNGTWLGSLLLPIKRRRRNTAPHPGLAVTCDLILWLAFLIGGFVALSDYATTRDFTSRGPFEVGDEQYEGSYYYSTETHRWLFKVTYVNPEANPPGTTVANFHRTCTPAFASCAAENAYVNSFLGRQGARATVALVVTAVVWLLTIVHFVLFVWDCVDTHRRRKGRQSRAARSLADEMIRDLQARGLISIHASPGAAAGYVPLQQQQVGAGGEKSRAAEPGDQISAAHPAGVRYA